MEWTPNMDCAYDADIDVGALSTNTYPITIQLKDFEGKNLDVRSSVILYYVENLTTLASTDVTTDMATTSDGSGAVIPILANYVYQLISEADGKIEVDSEDSGSTDQYLVLILPNGKIVISGVLTY